MAALGSLSISMQHPQECQRSEQTLPEDAGSSALDRSFRSLTCMAPYRGEALAG